MFILWSKALAIILYRSLINEIFIDMNNKSSIYRNDIIEKILYEVFIAYKEWQYFHHWNIYLRTKVFTFLQARVTPDRSGRQH